MKTTKSICALAMSLSVVAFAHGKDGVHLKGTLQAVAESAVTVKTTDGEEVSVHIDARTKFERGAKPVTRTDAVVGEKVVVHAMKMKDGSLHGHLVKLPDVRPANPPDETSATPGGKDAAHEHANQ